MTYTYEVQVTHNGSCHVVTAFRLVSGEPVDMAWKSVREEKDIRAAKVEVLAALIGQEK